MYAPTGEAMPFGGFMASLYGGMALTPDPVHLSSGWGGLNAGVVPSLEIARTSVGSVAFAGVEIGFDIYGPEPDSRVALVLNAKVQLLKEATYWPAIAVGVFQVSPEAIRSGFFGYFSLSKSFSAGDTELGQLTFGMMRSFAPDARVAPGCFTSGARWCVFRGTAPFEDGNGAFLAGYVSPWIGPISFGIDHVGGTSAASSTNATMLLRVWQDGVGGFAAAGIGGFFSNDRRGDAIGAGVEDGLFLQLYMVSSLAGLFGLDPTKEWKSDPGKSRTRRRLEDAPAAPPGQAPAPAPAPAPQPTPTAAPQPTP